MPVAERKVNSFRAADSGLSVSCQRAVRLAILGGMVAGRLAVASLPAAWRWAWQASRLAVGVAGELPPPLAGENLVDAIV